MQTHSISRLYSPLVRLMSDYLKKAIAQNCSTSHTGACQLQPASLYLEITDKCNMACPMCMTREHRHTPSGPVLTNRQIRKKILGPGWRIGIKGLAVSGGEPLLAENLFDVLNDALRLNYDIFLATNLLVSDMQLYRKLLSLLNDRRHTILISFDSSQEAEMNAIRGADVYGTVLKNSSALIELRNVTGANTSLWSSTVMQTENASSVMETIKFLIDTIGFDKAVIQPRSDYSFVSINNYRRQPFPEYPPDTLQMLVRISEQIYAAASTDARIRPNGRGLENWQRFFTNPHTIQGPCLSRNSIYIDSYGNYRGCLHGTILGNLHETDLLSYLKSDKYKEFINLTEVCKICIHGCS